MSQKKKYKLDLACGNNLGGKLSGIRGKDYIGVDIVGKPDTEADIVWDLLKFPWEFAKDNSVDEIFCAHFIEHIPHGNGFEDPFFKFFDEVYRILKPGGTAFFVCPYFTSVRAIQDPTHMRSIGEPTFFYLSKEWRKLNKLEHYPIKCDFELVKADHSVSEEFAGRASDAVTSQALHMWNVIQDLRVVLRKPKK